jgi:chromosome transmission fidelity protein 4
MGAEDGTVWRYDIESGKMEKLLVRCALPVRDLAISHDGEWIAVASEWVFYRDLLTRRLADKL